MSQNFPTFWSKNVKSLFVCHFGFFCRLKQKFYSGENITKLGLFFLIQAERRKGILKNCLKPIMAVDRIQLKANIA
jgi:hypothetical protein